jgi:hypothetical protein
MRCRVGAFDEDVSLEVVAADAALGSWRRLNGKRSWWQRWYDCCHCCW